MRILIAEDDAISRRVLETSLKTWSYEVIVAIDGTAAWAELQKPDAPRLAILDWMMPGMDGVDVCQRLRKLPGGDITYVLMLTAKDRKEDLALALDSGANDYLVKPFNRQELRARVGVGVRMIELQQQLERRVQELETAVGQVHQLQGLLPICCYCKSIRDEANYWQQVETYFSTHTDASFSHSICPACWDRVVKPEAAKAGVAIP